MFLDAVLRIDEEYTGADIGKHTGEPDNHGRQTEQSKVVGDQQPREDDAPRQIQGAAKQVAVQHPKGAAQNAGEKRFLPVGRRNRRTLGERWSVTPGAHPLSAQRIYSTFEPAVSRRPGRAAAALQQSITTR